MKRNPVVEIIGKNHKYKGEKAVIQFNRPKTYIVRLIDREKSRMEQFGFSGKTHELMVVYSKYITFSISKTNVKIIPGKFAPTLINKWQDDAIYLLNKHRNMTKNQLEKIYG